MTLEKIKSYNLLEISVNSPKLKVDVLKTKLWSNHIKIYLLN